MEAGELMQRLTRDNLGFLLAKASQHWNELLYERFSQAGYADVRPAYGSLLVPLFEHDGLHMGELARQAYLSKQTVTTLIRAMEVSGLVRREQDQLDRRAFHIYLTDRSHSFRPVAEQILKDLDAIVAVSLNPEQIAALTDALKALMNLELKPRTEGEDYEI
jgi:MarR family transcriptional regulator, organic hydroperoxide resistance regulator